ncbi:MAG: hypothetical protein M1409_02420 [Actinobacteria bacterium]|nr:hypothetical protein [Actinomycetota bacterium]
MKLSQFLKKEYLLLYLLIVIGAFLRLWGVYTNSFAFTYDVGRDMLALHNIVYLHKIPLIGATTGLPGIFYGPWWYYLLTPFFFIFSGNPQGIALTMALIGIAAIPVGFCFGKKLGGNLLGIFLAGIISVSGNLISLSSQIWNPNIAPLFILFIFLTLLRIFNEDKKDKSLYYFILGILLTFNIDLEIVFGLLLSIGIILSVIFVKKRKISFKNIVFFVLGSIVIIAPRVFFELRHQFLMTKTFLGFFAGASSSASKSPELVLNRFGIIFDQFNSTLALDNKLLGFTLILFIALSIFLFYKKAENDLKNFIKTSLIVIFVFLIGTVFFSHDIWPHYLVGLPVFYILLFCVSLYLLSKKFQVISWGILGIVFIINLNPLSVYKTVTQPLWIGDAAVYRNQLAVIDYVYNQASRKDFKYVVYTPPVYDYTYQYLFLWYGPKKYGYSPSIKSNTAFFILEPDLENPQRLIDWLKQRAGDGKIIKTEKLSSGIIVQTREVN